MISISFGESLIASDSVIVASWKSDLNYVATKGASKDTATRFGCLDRWARGLHQDGILPPSTAISRYHLGSTSSRLRRFTGESQDEWFCGNMCAGGSGRTRRTNPGITQNVPMATF